MLLYMGLYEPCATRLESFRRKLYYLINTQYGFDDRILGSVTDRFRHNRGLRDWGSRLYRYGTREVPAQCRPERDLAALPVFIVGRIIRTSEEERMLRAHLGAAYED
jgi:hypothetical protein